MTGRTTAAVAAAVALVAVAPLLALTVLGGGLSASLVANTAIVAGPAGLNTGAVPAWAVEPLQRAASTCPEISAPLLAAQIDVESGWDPAARNPRSEAMGLSQFMPGTWAEVGVDGDGDGTADPYNPLDAIPSQAKYMCQLIDMVRRMPGVTGELIDLTLAAYNAGPGNVAKHRGIPPFPETTNYVAEIRRLTATTYASTALLVGVGGAIGAVIQHAAAHVGRTPYAWGGGTLNGPSRGTGIDAHVTGFDCSSLVRYAYHQGTSQTVTLPRTSQEQYNATRNNPVALDALQPGDLLFWGGPATIHHVALYIGDQRMIEAPQSGQLVTETRIRTTGDFLGATRITNG